MGSCCSRSRVRREHGDGQLYQAAECANQPTADFLERTPSMPYPVDNAALNAVATNTQAGEMQWNGTTLAQTQPNRMTGGLVYNGGMLQRDEMLGSGGAQYYTSGPQEVLMSGASRLINGGAMTQAQDVRAAIGVDAPPIYGAPQLTNGKVMAGGGEGLLELHSFGSSEGSTSSDDGIHITNKPETRIGKATNPSLLPPQSFAPPAVGMGLVNKATTIAPSPSALGKLGLDPLHRRPFLIEDDVSMVETRSSAFDTPLNFDDETTASERSSSMVTGWMGRSGAGSFHRAGSYSGHRTRPRIESLALQHEPIATGTSVSGPTPPTGPARAQSGSTPLLRQHSNPTITVTSVRNNRTGAMRSSRPATPVQFLRQDSFQSSLPDPYASEDRFQSCRSLPPSARTTTTSGARTPLHSTTVMAAESNTPARRASERPPLPAPRGAKTRGTVAPRRGSGPRRSTATRPHAPTLVTAWDTTSRSATPLTRAASFHTCRSASTLPSPQSARPAAVLRSLTLAELPRHLASSPPARPSVRSTDVESVRTDLLQTPASLATVTSLVIPPLTPWPGSAIYHLDEDAMEPPPHVHVRLPDAARDGGAGGVETIEVDDNSAATSWDSAALPAELPVDLEVPVNLELPVEVELPGEPEWPIKLEQPIEMELPGEPELPFKRELPVELEQPIEIPQHVELDEVVVGDGWTAGPSVAALDDTAQDDVDAGPQLDAAEVANEGVVRSSYATMATLSSDSELASQRAMAAARQYVVAAYDTSSHLTAVTPVATDLPLDATSSLTAPADLTIPTAGSTSYAVWPTSTLVQQRPGRDASLPASSTTGNVLVCELSSSPSSPPTFAPARRAKPRRQSAPHTTTAVSRSGPTLHPSRSNFTASNGTRTRANGGGGGKTSSKSQRSNGRGEGTRSSGQTRSGPRPRTWSGLLTGQAGNGGARSQQASNSGKLWRSQTSTSAGPNARHATAAHTTGSTTMQRRQPRHSAAHSVANRGSADVALLDRSPSLQRHSHRAPTHPSAPPSRSWVRTATPSTSASLSRSQRVWHGARGGAVVATVLDLGEDSYVAPRQSRGAARHKSGHASR